MQRLEISTPNFNDRPEKILQFGEGNFLRAFVDWMINSINENGAYNGSIVLCQPIPTGLCEKINSQNGVYHVVMRGIENGEPIEHIKKITSVSRCINPYQDYQAFLDIARSEDLQVVISNTTEAGISYDPTAKMGDCIPSSFPAKVTVLLYVRYQAFHGDPTKGLLFLPVELIDNNGAELKRLVLCHAQQWGLEAGFIRWVEEHNCFTSTLVDRIVTGYPRDQVDYFDDLLGYHDDFLDTCETFNLWVIEGDPKWADVLPVHKGSGNVIWTDDVTPYKKRKVRILNGAHTSTVLAGYLAGHNFVLDLMHDPVFKEFMETLIYKEVVPILDLPHEELMQFAKSISDRFSNPYIKHKLLDISLNSCSKFETRCLPSLLEYYDQNHQFPSHLCFAFAAFIAFYNIRKESDSFIGTREDGTTYPVRDDASVLAFFETAWKSQNLHDVVHSVLSNSSLWRGKDLSLVPGLVEEVSSHLHAIQTSGVRDAMFELTSCV